VLSIASCLLNSGMTAETENAPRAPVELSAKSVPPDEIRFGGRRVSG
jgi:hypothetical protein